MKVVDQNTLTTALSFDTVVDTIGIVLGDRDETKSNNLKLYIPRLMLGIDLASGKGDTVEMEASIDIDIENSINKDIGSNNITLTNYIEVPPMIIPGITLPRFEKGEIVKLTFADNDVKSPTYYPFSLGNEVLKRKTDIIRYHTPAKEKYDDPLSEINSYYMEINSRDQFFRIHTSDKNGETCPFTLNFNTKDGIITLMDNTKRKFLWEYKKDKIMIQTDGGARTTWCKSDITHECETYNVFATNYVNIETSKYKLKSDKGDFYIDNMYTENISKEHKASVAILNFDDAAQVGNTWQTIAPGLYLDSPAVKLSNLIYHSAHVFVGIPAPGPSGSPYSGGAVDGERSSKPGTHGTNS